MRGVDSLWRQLAGFVREDFDPVVYGGTAVMLALLAWANYGTEALTHLHRTSERPGQLLQLAWLYGLPWLCVIGLQWSRGRLPPRAVEPGLAARACLALVVVSVADWFPFHLDLVERIPEPVRPWARPVLWNLKSSLCWFLPLAVCWAAWDRPHTPTLYGLTRGEADLRPLLLLLGALAPLVWWASSQPAFLAIYPTYAPWLGVETYLGVSPWLTVLVYELVYGLDFVFVEMFFRGFLVIGLARWLGPRAVLPMVAVYAALHLGKPLPELVGSALGGYALGVFAWRSNSIAAGVLLHVGLAWGMEAAAMTRHLAG